LQQPGGGLKALDGFIAKICLSVGQGELDFWFEC
jgi:hypothetical protein